MDFNILHFSSFSLLSINHNYSIYIAHARKSVSIYRFNAKMRHFFGGRFNILTFNIWGNVVRMKDGDLKSIIHHNLMAIMKFLQVK